MKTKLIVLFSICISALGCNAQTSAADSTLVRIACENYVAGFYRGDSSRVRKAVHPELVKRIIARQQDFAIRNMSAQQLVMAAGSRSGQGFKDDKTFQIKVFVYDISYDIALAKIETNKMEFIDYAQLARIKGEWKIINVLWAFKR